MNLNLDDAFLDVVNSIPLKEKTEKSKATADRNKTIFLRYTGLNGKGSETLEGIGKSYGLTRECIRQIVGRLDKKVEIKDSVVSAVNELISMIDMNSPIESRVLSEIAYSKKMLKDLDYDLVNPALYFASKLGVKMNCELEKLNGSLFLLPNGYEIKPNHIISEASKVVNRYGVCSIESLIIRFDLENTTSIWNYIQSSVESTGGCVWIDGEKNHFYLDRERTNRMDRRLEQIFSVYKSVNIEKLYQALARSLRQATDGCEQSPEYKAFVGEEKVKGHQNEKNRRMAIDEKLLKNYLVAKGYKVSRHNVVSVNSEIETEYAPLPLELNVIDILKNQPKGQLREIDIENKLSIDPKSKEHFSFVTTTYYSSLMIRADRGILELLGQPR